MIEAINRQASRVSSGESKERECKYLFTHSINNHQ